MKKKLFICSLVVAMNAMLAIGCTGNKIEPETETEILDESTEENYILGKEFTLKLNETVDVEGLFEITLIDRYDMYDGGEEGKTQITINGETYTMFIGLSENNNDKHYPRMIGNTVLPYKVEVKEFTDEGPVVICSERVFPEPLVLSGNSEDVIVTDDYEYVIGEKCNLFIDKGCTISGDTLVIIENIMTELENESGLKFNNESVYSQVPDDLGRNYFDDEYWNDYNRYGKDNINIYLINISEDDNRISCANNRACVLMNDDYNFKEYGIGTAAHEIAHVLQGSNFESFDTKITEGFAVYWSLKMIGAFPEYQLSEESLHADETEKYYYFGTSELNEDTAEELYMTEWDRSEGNQPYEYGFGLMTYLYETYSLEKVNEFFQILSDRLMNERLKDPSGKQLWEVYKFAPDSWSYEIDGEELKNFFGEDVFKAFGKWYRENEKRFSY